MSSAVCVLKGVPIITTGSLKSRKNGNPGMPIFTGCVYFHDTGTHIHFQMVVSICLPCIDYNILRLKHTYMVLNTRLETIFKWPVHSVFAMTDPEGVPWVPLKGCLRMYLVSPCKVNVSTYTTAHTSHLNTIRIQSPTV